MEKDEAIGTDEGDQAMRSAFRSVAIGVVALWLIAGAGPTLSAAQDLYVADAGLDSVVQFDGTTGDWIRNFASGGGGGQAGWLACAPNGNLLMTRSFAHHVVEFDNATGANLGAFAATSLNVPTGLTFGPNGNLFVANRDGHDVVEFDGTTGTFVGVFASALPGKPFALEFGPNGNLFVAVGSGTGGASDSVVELDGVTGALVTSWPTLGIPRGLTFGPSGHLFVSLLATDTVAEFDPATGSLLRTLSGGVVGPHGLRFGPNGNLFVASLRTSQVVEFDIASGAPIGPFATSGLSLPVGIIFGTSSGPCGPTHVDIDIKPGSFPNSINLGSSGVIPVAILGSETFDATTVDGSTISLGGATVRLVGKGNRLLCHEEDVNDDLISDLVCQVENLAELITIEGESIAVLEAETFTGVPIRGEDTIRIVP